MLARSGNTSHQCARSVNEWISIDGLSWRGQGNEQKRGIAGTSRGVSPHVWLLGQLTSAQRNVRTTAGYDRSALPCMR